MISKMKAGCSFWRSSTSRWSDVLSSSSPMVFKIIPATIFFFLINSRATFSSRNTH